jgi:hypothetical protein
MRYEVLRSKDLLHTSYKKKTVFAYHGGIKLIPSNHCGNYMYHLL